MLARELPSRAERDREALGLVEERVILWWGAILIKRGESVRLRSRLIDEARERIDELLTDRALYLTRSISLAVSELSERLNRRGVKLEEVISKGDPLSLSHASQLPR